MNSGLKSKFSMIVGLSLVLVAPALVRAEVPDSDINYNVNDALRADPRVNGSEVNATTENGIVTLTGSVDNLAAKTFAVAEAKKIKGVLGAIDKLSVTPSYRADTDVANAVRRRILNSVVINSQGLFVTTKDGVVTLTGTVDSYPEEQQAGLLASEVRGVKEVKNDIITKWRNNRSDSDVKEDAITALRNDVYLAGESIDVTVKGGIISLSGSVANAYERDRAFDDVRWISNVNDVNNGLKVEWFENRGTKTKTETPSDETLKKTVRKSLDQDSRLIADAITIRTSFGEVTLDGSVASHYEKIIAEQDAKNVLGVAWMRNNLFVRADQREDWAIEDDVDFNLDTDAVTEDFNINPSVRKGVVTLTGQVHSWYQWSHAYDVASRVRGVKAVIDNITVSAASDTNGSNWNRDADLAKSVKSRLRSNWVTWWVLDKINVTVRDGVATIQGDVNTWKELQQAGELALHTQGISEVDNRLTVNGVAYPWDEYHLKVTSF